MWTVEQLIGLGLFMAHENDIPANAEIRLIPRAAVAGQQLKLYKANPIEHVRDEKYLPVIGYESDIVTVQAVGHPRIAETVYYAYSYTLNVLAIILDG